MSNERKGKEEERHVPESDSDMEINIERKRKCIFRPRGVTLVDMSFGISLVVQIGYKHRIGSY
jgi:hypothetical protein